MEIITNYENIKIEDERLIEQKQVISQCNLDTSQKGGVKEISTAYSKSIIKKVQYMPKQAKVFGQTNVKVLYINKDGNLQSFDYISDFVESVNLSDFSQENNTNIRINVVDCVVSISGDEIKVQSVIEISVYGIGFNEKKILTKIENAITQSNMEKIQNFSKYLNEDVLYTTEYKTGVLVDNIYLFDANAEIVDVEYNSFSIKVIGQGNIHIIYSAEGIISEKNIPFTFSKDINVQEEEVNICPYVEINETKLTILGSDLDNTFSIDVNLKIKGALFNISNQYVITDLYSPTYETKIEEVSIDYIEKNGIKIVEKEVEGSVEIESGDVQKIVAYNIIQNNIVNTYIDDLNIITEGFLVVSILYENKNGNILNTQIQMPYTVSLEDRETGDNCNISANILILDSSSKIKRDSEISVNITFICTLCKCENKVFQGIENVVVLSKIDKKPSAITMYRPKKGDKLWDVAKALGVSKDKILEQNPDLKEELNGDERVLVYREIDM